MESPEDLDDDPDTFNMADYNSSRLRETKVKTNTLQYRRDTLKGNLSNVPTPLLLQRVPDGTIKNESGWDQVISKTRIVKKLQKPKVDQSKLGERSQNDLWKSLAKKYSGKPIDESGSDGMSVQSRRTPAPTRINRTRTPNTMSTTATSSKRPLRTVGSSNTLGSGK